MRLRDISFYASTPLGGELRRNVHELHNGVISQLKQLRPEVVFDLPAAELAAGAAHERLLAAVDAWTAEVAEALAEIDDPR